MYGSQYFGQPEFAGSLNTIQAIEKFSFAQAQAKIYADPEYYDRFNRPANTDSWGSADIGGTYTLFDVAADYDTNGSQGTFTIGAALDTRRVSLNSVSSIFQDTLVSFTADKLPTSGGFPALGIGPIHRYVDDNNFYRVKVTIESSGTMRINTIKNVGGVETDVSSLVTPGDTYTPGQKFWIRFQTSGSFPTVLSAKFWLDGSAEPAFQVSDNDSTAALQVFSAVGLQVSNDAITNNPIVVSWDDLQDKNSPITRQYAQAQAYVLNGHSHAQAQAFTAYTSITDTFTRSVSAGSWGTADVGGPYSTSSFRFSVNGTKGVLSGSTGTALVTNQLLETILPSIVEISAIINYTTFDNVSNNHVYLVYQDNPLITARIVTDFSGSARVDYTVDGSSYSTLISSQTLSLSTDYTFKLQINNSGGKIRYRGKLWQSSATEPGWSTASDTTITGYTKPVKGPGIYYLSNGGSSNVTVDNFSAAGIGWTETGQVQTRIKQTYRGFAQATALIAGTSTVARDNFNRTVGSGTTWGTSSGGDTWIRTSGDDGNATYSVDGSQGVLTQAGFAGTFEILPYTGLGFNDNTPGISGRYIFSYTNNNFTKTHSIGTSDYSGTVSLGTLGKHIRIGASFASDGTSSVSIVVNGNVLATAATVTIGVGDNWQVIYQAFRTSNDSIFGRIKIWKVGDVEPDWSTGTLSGYSASKMLPGNVHVAFGSLAGTETLDDLEIIYASVTMPAQAQAKIQVQTATSQVAQAQADIKATSNSFAQAQADIKATTFVFAQSQADIKQTSRGYSQAQADIKQTSYAFAQAQADIKATTSVFAQAQADIKATSFVFAQAQADIKQIYQGYAQANAYILNGHKHGQAQAYILNGHAHAQAQTLVNGSFFKPFIDTFTRTSPSDLGTSDNGDVWVASAGATASVNGSAGIITSTANSNWDLNKTLIIPNQSEGLEFLLTFSIDTLPPSGTARIRFGLQNGAATQITGLSVSITSAGTATYGGSNGGNVATTSMAVVAGTNYTIKVHHYYASGFMAARIKMWQTSGTEPGWAFNDLMTLGGSPYPEIPARVRIAIDSATGACTFTIDNLQINDAAITMYGQAQARIKQTYNASGQAQADIKATSNVFAQAQADIKATSNSFAQAQADIKATSFVFAQAQADIKATSFVFAQAQADIKAKSSAFAQAQADIKQTYSVFAQAQTTIAITTWSFAQAQCKIATTRVHAQAQADIKAVSWGFGQAQADIKQTYFAFAQAQADIKQTYNAFAQAQAQIKQTYNQFAQAQADIKAIGYGWAQAQCKIATTRAYAQAQADIKQTYQGYAQAQADIKAIGRGFAQAQADIKATGNAFGQAQADIKQTYNSFAQAQADIKQTYQGYAQAQCQVKQTYFGFGQVQADIKAIGYGFAQAQCKINTTRAYGQSQADIKATSWGFGQANCAIAGGSYVWAQAQAKIKAFGVQAYAQSQADIKARSNAFAQAQADILVTSNGFGQAQAKITQTYFGFAQAQCKVKATTWGFGQAQADIKAKNNAFAQAQCYIQSSGIVCAQAQAYIKITDIEAFAQAQARIKQVYSGFGQSQADIKQTYAQFAQAQSDIKQTYNAFAQAQTTILATSYAVAQAQAYIYNSNIVVGQAQAHIKATYQGYGQAQAQIIKSAGYAQAQAFIRQDRIIQNIEVSDIHSLVINISDRLGNAINIEDAEVTIVMTPTEAKISVGLTDTQGLIVRVSDREY